MPIAVLRAIRGNVIKKNTLAKLMIQLCYVQTVQIFLTWAKGT
jgi:hypothetical protein